MQFSVDSYDEDGQVGEAGRQQSTWLCYHKLCGQRYLYLTVTEESLGSKKKKAVRFANMSEEVIIMSA